MGRLTRRGAAVAAVFAGLAMIAGSTAALAAHKPKGKSDKGTSYAAIVRMSGGFEYAAGYTTDKLFGAIAVTYKLKLQSNTPGTVSVTAKPVILFTPTGELSGTGSATLTIGTGGSATITAGKLTLKKGTGGQKGHRFDGTFTGSGNVTPGLYQFNYRGTYK